MAITSSLNNTQKRILRTGLSEPVSTPTYNKERILSTAVSQADAGFKPDTTLANAQLSNVNGETTPTGVTSLIKDALHQRIAATKSFKTPIQESLLAAQAGPDIGKFPGYSGLSPEALMDIQRVQQQGLTNRATGLLNLQESLGTSIDKSLGDVKDIFAERNALQQQAIENQRQEQLLYLQALTLERGLNADLYARERDRIEDQAKNLTNTITALKEVETDPFTGNLTEKSRMLLEALGMTESPENVDLVINAGVENMPTPRQSGTITTDVGQKTRTHTGAEIDIVYKGGMGAPVPAFIGGEVVAVKDGKERAPGSLSFGNYVKVRDASGAVHTYAHLQNTLVKIGDLIKAGEVVGKQGNSGDTVGKTGVHVHYQINDKSGKLQNAERYVTDYKKRILAGLAKTQIPAALKGILPGPVNVGLSAIQKAAGQVPSVTGSLPTILPPQEENYQPVTPDVDLESVPFNQQAIQQLMAQNPTDGSPADMILDDWASGVDPQSTMNKIVSMDVSKDKVAAAKAFAILQSIYGQGVVQTKSDPLTTENILKLRTDFRNEPQVKSFEEIQRQYGQMQEVWSAYQSGQLKAPSVDQVLGVTFQKILDPASIVRESEFARTAAGQSMLARVQAGYEQVVTGGVGMTDDLRQELVEAAGILLNQSRSTYKRVEEDYREFAERSGIDPVDVIGSGRDYIVPDAGVKLIRVREKAPPYRTGSIPEPEFNSSIYEIIQ